MLRDLAFATVAVHPVEEGAAARAAGVEVARWGILEQSRRIGHREHILDVRVGEPLARCLVAAPVIDWQTRAVFPDERVSIDRRQVVGVSEEKRSNSAGGSRLGGTRR